MKEKEILNQLLSSDKVIKALDYLKNNDEFAIGEQIDLAMIEAPTTYEDNKAKTIENKFKELNLLNINIDDIKNVYGFYNDLNDSILVEAHLDTVFPFNTIKDRPVIDSQGYINLPSITDDTRGLEVILSIIRALKYANIKTKKNIMFAGTSREEGIGSISGMKKLVDDFDNIEASISIDGDHYSGIIYKAIGLLTKRYTFKGLSGHAYVAFGQIAHANHACGRAIAKISNMEVSMHNPKCAFAVTNIHGGTFEGLHAINDEVSFIVNYRSESKEELIRIDKQIEKYVKQAIIEEENRWGVNNQISYSVETLCDIPAGYQNEDTPLIRAYQEVVKYMGDIPALEEGICCNANAMISIGKPAVCMGAGSKHNANIHSLNERFYTIDAYKQSQCALLLLLMMSGSEVSDSIFD